MRYVQIDNISFTDVIGNTYAIKDMRPIPACVKFAEVDVKGDDQIDEIASRDTTYRAGGEDQSFKIFDMNIVRLVEVGYDMSRMRTLEIPI